MYRRLVNTTEPAGSGLHPDALTVPRIKTVTGGSFSARGQYIMADSPRALCTAFRDTGSCQYGENCIFDHGNLDKEAELANLDKEAELAMQADNSPIEEARQIDPRLYDAKIVRFSPDSKRTKKEFREGGVDLKVISVDKKTGVVKYSAPRDKTKYSTNVKHLVLSPKDKLYPDRSDFKMMTERYSLAENDIFCTPPVVFDFMSATYGFDVKAAFDPCPANIVPWNGLEIDWPLDKPVFVNPPFSKIFTDWLDKVCQQVLRGVDVIMLISSDCYYMVEGVDRCRKWEDIFAKFHIQKRICSIAAADRLQLYAVSCEWNLAYSI